MTQLSIVQVAQWATEHGKCLDGECSASWTGWEAAYFCQHCINRRIQIEDGEAATVCDHGGSVREAMNEITIMAGRLGVSVETVIAIAKVSSWPAVQRAAEQITIQRIIADEKGRQN